MGTFSTIKHWVDKVMEWLCIVILAIMTVLVTYQVVTRYVFGKPSAFSEILAQYLFVWMIMYGSAYVFGLKEHLEITILKDRFQGKTLLIVEIITNVTLFLFSAGIVIYGGGLITGQQMGTIDAALQIPMGVIYSCIPISGVFTLFYAVYNIALAFHVYHGGQPDITKDCGSTM